MSTPVYEVRREGGDHQPQDETPDTSYSYSDYQTLMICVAEDGPEPDEPDAGPVREGAERSLPGPQAGHGGDGVLG